MDTRTNSGDEELRLPDLVLMFLALDLFCVLSDCDETFDFQAMGRIFVGLCQCGQCARGLECSG